MNIKRLFSETVFRNFKRNRNRRLWVSQSIANHGRKSGGNGVSLSAVRDYCTISQTVSDQFEDAFAIGMENANTKEWR